MVCVWHWLAQEGAWGRQQLFLIRAVRAVAVEAAFAYRGVFPDEGAALLLVAAVAGLVHRIRLEQGLRRRAMRVVAIDAGHLPFGQGHVRALAELHALLLMTAVASLGNAVGLLQAGGRELRHRVVAVRAGQPVGLVRGRAPEDALVAVVALQTYRVALVGAVVVGRLAGFRRLAGEADDQGLVLLLLAGFRRFARKADDERLVHVVFVGVARTGPVAGLTAATLKIVLRIEAKSLGVSGMRELVVLCGVAREATLLADVFRALGKADQRGVCRAGRR